MTILFSNNASTIVAGSIASIDTTVTVQSGTAFPHPLNVGDYFVATFYDQQTKTLNEIVHVTNLTGNVATIVRGQEGTTPLAWNAGDIFANLVTAGTLEAFTQQGAVPVNTTDVYVGDDVSLVPNHIVCNTVPVPTAYGLGMVFVIRVKNTITGPTDLTLNGKPAILAKRTDGSDMVAGTLIGAQDYIFIYNGTFFSTTIMPVPIPPPVATFYVRSDSTSIIDVNGIESNSGFYNTPQDAFKSVQGGMNTIKLRYISTDIVHIQVADGTYIGGWQETSQYVNKWVITGNPTNPQNVVIDATSTNPSSYVKGAYPGYAVVSEKLAHMDVNGFTIKSYWSNFSCPGWLTIHNCNLNGPLGSAVCVTSGGIMNLYGAFKYSQSNPCTAVFATTQGGRIFIQDRTLDLSVTDTSWSLQMMGSYSLVAILMASAAATVGIHDEFCSVSGPQSPGCSQWNVSSGASITFGAGNDQLFAPIAGQPGQNSGGYVN